MERLRILSLLVVCAGCRQGAVSMAEGELLVNPSSVNFGITWLGHRATAKISLQNTARSGIDVTLTPEDPFDAPGSVHLGGGEQLEVELGVTGLGEQRTLTGQIDPPARMSVEVRSLEGSTMLETDGLGRFSFGIATGPVSLRVLRGDGPPLQTPWTLI